MEPLKLQRNTINPYRIATGTMLRRLQWDLNMHSWISRSRIKSWQNRYVGRKAVILCNGPSLLKVDFGLLSNCFTFGLNKINLLFKNTPFRPSCVVAVNPFVIEQNAKFYNETTIPLFIDCYASRKKLVSMRPNVIFLHSGPEGFARDCSISVSQGYTVTYVAMQLAFHMGFKDVALVGCDHNFAVSGPENLAVVSGERDESHFDPNYFSGGLRWNLPDLFESEVSYGNAKRVYESFGRAIVNATDGGKLEIFKRLSLEKFVSDNFYVD